ncbi:hypothetical protein EV175_007698, partial [Coemansia sp. RSA 1933]
MLVQEQRIGRHHQNGGSRRAVMLPISTDAQAATERQQGDSGSVFPELPPFEPWPELIESPRQSQMVASAVVRRKSTKLWGCIPEEIRPRSRRGAIDSSSGDSQQLLSPPPPAQPQPADSSGNDEIVRRALSLLRKPEPNPQAEKAIVEAAL